MYLSNFNYLYVVVVCCCFCWQQFLILYCVIAIVTAAAAAGAVAVAFLIIMLFSLSTLSISQGSFLCHPLVCQPTLSKMLLVFLLCEFSKVVDTHFNSDLFVDVLLFCRTVFNQTNQTDETANRILEWGQQCRLMVLNEQHVHLGNDLGVEVSIQG